MDINTEIKNLKEAFDELFNISELKITDAALKAKMKQSWGSHKKAQQDWERGSNELEKKYNADTAKNPGKASDFGPDGNETDVEQEARFYPKETAKLSKDITTSNRELDRYHRARERYNKRNPENQVPNLAAKDGYKPEYQSSIPKGSKKDIYRTNADHWGWFPKKMNDNNSLQEQLHALIEEFSSLFEATGVEQAPEAARETEVSPNKISQKKKGKDGKETEVVSVADELFPYEGNAKQQYNQKIIAKINDMIQGTATLQDLIHLVRQKKVANVKESYEEMPIGELIEELKEKLAHRDSLVEALDNISKIYGIK